MWYTGGLLPWTIEGRREVEVAYTIADEYPTLIYSTRQPT